jgi:hypothetical protein
VRSMSEQSAQLRSVSAADFTTERRLSPMLLAATLVVLALIGSTLGLWAYYGTAVFYEMIAAGLAACL